MVAAEFPDVNLIALSENTGYAEGNNIAMRSAIGDAILLLNPDVRLFENALDTAYKVLKSSPSPSAVSVKFLNPDGTLQLSLRGFPDPKSLFYEVSGLSRVFSTDKKISNYFMRWFDYKTQIEVDQPMATFLMIVREAYEKVGEFDTQFPIFFNDVDWCYRAKKSGVEIFYTPDASIIHYGGQGTKKAPKRKMIDESHRSLIKLWEKHYRKDMSPVLFNLCCNIANLAGLIRMNLAPK